MFRNYHPFFRKKHFLPFFVLWAQRRFSNTLQSVERSVLTLILPQLHGGIHQSLVAELAAAAQGEKYHRVPGHIFRHRQQKLGKAQCSAAAYHEAVKPEAGQVKGFALRVEYMGVAAVLVNINLPLAAYLTR